MGLKYSAALEKELEESGDEGIEAYDINKDYSTPTETQESSEAEEDLPGFFDFSANISRDIKHIGDKGFGDWLISGGTVSTDTNDAIGDLVHAGVRGIYKGAEEFLNLGNLAVGDNKTNYTDQYFNKPENIAEEMVSFGSQFLVPASAFAKAGTVAANLMMKGATTLGPTTAKSIIAASSGGAGSFSAQAVGSVIASNTVFEPSSPTLANMLNEIPALKGPIMEAMSTDINDPEWVNRLRHSISELGLAGVANKVIGLLSQGIKSTGKGARGVHENMLSGLDDSKRAEMNILRDLVGSKDASFKDKMALIKHDYLSSFAYAKFTTSAVDRYAGIKHLMPDNQSYALARLLAGNPSRIDEMLNYRSFNMMSNGDLAFNDVKSMRAIFEPIVKHKDGNQLTEFTEYALADRLLRNIDRLNKAEKTAKVWKAEDFLGVKVTNKQLKLWKTQGNKLPHFRKAYKEMTEFNNNILDLLAHPNVQMISRTTRNRLSKANPMMVPLYRLMQESRNQGVFGSGVSSVSSAITTPLKGLKDTASPVQVNNLVDNMVKNYAGLIDSAFVNQTKVALYNDIKMMLPNEGAAYARPYKPKATQVGLTKRELRDKASKELGISREAMDEIDDIDDYLSIYGFAHGVPAKSKNGHVIDSVRVVDENGVGRVEHWEIIDPLLHRAVSALGPKGMHPLLGAMAFAKRILTVGVTSNPVFFMWKNPIRDTVSATILSTSSNTLKGVMKGDIQMRLPVVESMRGLYHSLRKDVQFHEFLINGGGFASVVENELRAGSKANLAAHIKVSKTTGGMLLGPNNIKEQWQHVVTAFEYGSRTAEYNHLIRKGMSRADAALAAREIATDFSMHGSSPLIQIMMAGAPFFNAGLQGLYRGKRGVFNQKNRATVWARLFTWTALPAVAEFYLNKDNIDPNTGRAFIEGIPQYIRNTHMVVPTDDKGGHFLIPNAFEFGAVNALVKNLLFGMVEKNGQTMSHEFVASIIDMFRLNPTPQVIKPFIDPIAGSGTAINSKFTGVPIVPASMGGIESNEKYKPWTPAQFIPMSKMFNSLGDITSPLELEHIWNSMFGTIGMYVSSATDAVIRSYGDGPKAPESEFSNYPFLKEMIWNTETRASEYELQLYDSREKTGKSKSTLDFLLDKDDPYFNSKVDEYVEDPDFIDLYSIAPAIADAMSAIYQFNKQSARVWNDTSPNLSAKDKQLKLREIKRQRNAVINDVYDALKGANKSRDILQGGDSRSNKEIYDSIEPFKL